MASPFRRLLPVLALTYSLQAAASIPHILLRSDRLYDASGSLGFIAALGLTLYPHTRGVGLPALNALDKRQLIMSVGVALWAGRLGTFLVQRIFKHGKDSRFDEIKNSPPRFFVAWMAQATWITLAALPTYLINTSPPTILSRIPLGLTGWAGLALFVGSFLVEAIADRQKTVWRREKDEGRHKDKFISSGLWAISRHPNYVGEVGIWAGLWLLSSKALVSPAFPRYTVYVAIVSPIFEYLLLNYVSGVPLLEQAADKKFHGDPDYEAYKRKVPVFFPWGTNG